MLIKDEFKKLIPALTAEEYGQLEANCLRDGILTPIYLWNDFIIDGHNRYQIAMQHELKFECLDFDFANEFEVKEWMVVNQLGRRNLTNEQKSYLIGKRYENEKQKHGGASYQNDNSIRTAKKIRQNELLNKIRQVLSNPKYSKLFNKN